jgi:glutamyl endopeptidase
MLRFSLASTQYVCTGVLFAPRKVLTAGHCVYDSDTNTYVSGLTFTPGQALAPNGTWLAPFGVLPASAVTVFKNYLSTNTSAAGDLAVVHLNDTDLASRVGVMPLSSSGCGGGPRPLALTTAGYPVDKPLGSCWEDGCGVTLDCASGVSRHTCDTALGQSGSPLWDGQGRVRAVHVRGDDTYNEAITLTEPVVQAINSW